MPREWWVCLGAPPKPGCPGHPVVITGRRVVVALVPVVNWLFWVGVRLRVVHFVRARGALDGQRCGVPVSVVACGGRRDNIFLH